MAANYTDDHTRRDEVYKQKNQPVTAYIGDHVTSRAFQCAACDRQFASRKYLSMHMALHKMTGEPPLHPPVVCTDLDAAPGPVRLVRQGAASQQWSCPVCGKTFAQNSNFRNHVRTHSDERPYVCLVCLIGFKERYHLKKHTLFKHSPGQLNEACRQCGKRFKDLTAVRAHERTHSDARPYACSRCDKTFKTSECLWHHENRSKTCGRITPSGGALRIPQRYGVNVAAGIQSSFRRRQRRNRVTYHEAQSADSDARSSTTESAATASTLLTHFIESSSTVNGDQTMSTSSHEVCSTSNLTTSVALGSKPDAVVAELFDCDISDLWASSLSTDGDASFCHENVDINLCTQANCFDDLIATTTSLTDNTIKSSCDASTKVIDQTNQQLWDCTTPTDLSLENAFSPQSSFVINDNAFKTICSYSERHPLYERPSCQRNGTTCVYDGQTISSCSTTVGLTRCECGRDLTSSALSCPTLLEASASSSNNPSNSVFSGSYLPTAVVAPIKRDRHRATTSPPMHYVVSSSQQSAKTFNLPPIETFAPRRRPRRPPGPGSGWSVPSDVPRNLQRRPQQQCPTVARYLTSSGARNQLIHANKSEAVGGNHFTSHWQQSTVL